MNEVYNGPFNHEVAMLDFLATIPREWYTPLDKEELCNCFFTLVTFLNRCLEL